MSHDVGVANFKMVQPTKLSYTTPSAPMVAAYGSVTGEGEVSSSLREGSCPPESKRPPGGIPRTSTRAIWQQLIRSDALRRTVSGNQARFLDRSSSRWCGGRRPRSSARTAASNPSDGTNFQPIALGKRLRHAGCDLRGKAGQHGQRGGDEGGSSDGGNSLDHDGPLNGPSRPRRFVGGGSSQCKFPAVFAGSENDFVRVRVLFRRPLADETIPARRG